MMVACFSWVTDWAAFSSLTNDGSRSTDVRITTPLCTGSVQFSRRNSLLHRAVALRSSSKELVLIGSAGLLIHAETIPHMRSHLAKTHAHHLPRAPCIENAVRQRGIGPHAKRQDLRPRLWLETCRRGGSPDEFAVISEDEQITTEAKEVRRAEARFVPHEK